jgi:LPS export ABC transporter permease LptF
MLIKKIFYRELISNAFKIFTVILLILPLTELFKLFDAVSSGSIPKGAVFTMVTFGVLASFPQALTITCLLAVVITLNRMCKDQEYVIWLTSGISPFYWFKLTAIFAVSMMVICAVSTMYITPWANLKVKVYTNYLFKEEINTFLSPGVFKEDANTGQVYYLKSYSLIGGEANNIFAQYTDNKTNILYNITSKSGDISNDNGLLLLQLHNGSRIQLTNDPKNNTYSLINFDTFQAKINQKFDEHAAIGNSFHANESNINI